MFQGCTSLTTAPQIYATELATSCCYGMFQGCTSLTKSPVLLAKTLKTSSYRYMFYGCSSLNSITCLATDISATNCTNGWVTNVASSGTFTKAASMTSWTTGNNGIPIGWTTVDYSE
jgi:bacteriorhodopsin